MSRLSIIAARKVRARRTTLLASALLLAGATTRLAAQDCGTIDPTTDPATGIIEGLVVGTSPGNRSRNAAVATDFEGKFIVAYEMGSQAPFTRNDLYVQRFNADGTCFCGVGGDGERGWVR